MLCSWARNFTLTVLLHSQGPQPLCVFTLSSDWFALLFTFVVIGHFNCFGFGFTTFNIESRSISYISYVKNRDDGVLLSKEYLHVKIMDQ